MKNNKTASWVAAGSMAMLSMVTGAEAEDRVIATAPGGRIEFRVDGTGPAILMIPSLGRGASDFEDLTRRLAASGFTAVRPEPRGIGRSTGQMNNITLHDLAGDAAAVIEALGASPAIARKPESQAGPRARGLLT